MTLRFWAEECPYTILYICYAHYDSDPVSPLIPSPVTHMPPLAVLPSYSGTLTSTVSQIRFLPRKQFSTRGSRLFTQLQVSGLCLFFPSITKKNNWSWNVGISFASFYHWFWPIRSTVSHGFIDCLLLFYRAPLPTQDNISWHTFTEKERVLTLPWLQLKTNTLIDFQSWYWAQRFASKERRPHNLDQVRF